MKRSFTGKTSIALPALALLLTSLIAAAPATAQAPGQSPEVTEALCRACHSGHFELLAENPHSVLTSEAWRERTGNQPACLNCHGDVSAHISQGGGQGGVRAFADELPTEINQVCLDCHQSSHPEFERSAHAQAGLSCVNCHSQHGESAAGSPLLREIGDALGRLEQLGASSRLCTDCHDDVLSAFGLNERHRLREGVLECTSCHNPHEPATRSLLGGVKQQLCIDCHTDKGGPFVFEHPVSRVDGCTTCHSPHGSPNRHLLNHQRVAELCIGCHATVPQFHIGFNPAAPSRFSLDTQCTNCHSSIHGSNFHPRFLR